MNNTLRAVILALLFLLSVTCQSASLSDVVKGNRHSVIYVKVQKADGKTGAVTEQHGTGFVVNKAGFVITAAHVVSSGAGFQIDVRGAEASSEGTLEGMEVVYENSNFDVALLRFKNTAKERKAVVLGDPWSVPDDAVIYAMGFPGTEEWFHTEGKLSGKVGPKGSWNTTITLNTGMSGGPIFTSDGKVVAMTWGGVPTEGIAGINRILPVNLLYDPLKFAGAVFSANSPVSPTPGEAIEIVYKVDKTQEPQVGLKPTENSYRESFEAKPGYKIVEYKYIEKSNNQGKVSAPSISNDGKSLSIDFALRSGPVFGGRGWLDAEILTRQIKE